jgi:hypothetical protein
MKINDLVKASMLEIGAVASGELPTADENEDVLRKLNSMLARWATKKTLIPASTSESFSLAAGTAQYTMGSGGTASSARAIRIINAFIRDSANIDYPVEIISEAEYNAIADKTVQSRPYKLFYDAPYGTGYINFYPTPGAVETAHIESLKPLSEIALSGISGDFNLDREYEEAVQLNLAIRIAPMFGRSVSAELAVFAEEALSDIMSLNAATKTRKRVRADIGIPGIRGRRYNINSG